jgi:hypothetical protein
MLFLALIMVLYYSENIHIFLKPKNIYLIVLLFQLILKGKLHPSHLKKDEAKERGCRAWMEHEFER